MRRATERIKLNSMPYDKFVDGCFIHATGYEVLCDGEWYLEYQGEEFEDAEDCIYKYEDEEEEEEENHCIYIYDDEMTEA